MVGHRRTEMRSLFKRFLAPYLKPLAYFALTAYCLGILVTLPFKESLTGPAVFWFFPFYLFIPGLAVTLYAFRPLKPLEAIVAVLALSLALVVGLKALIRTFRLEAYFTESSLLAFASMLAFLGRAASSLCLLYTSPSPRDRG